MASPAPVALEDLLTTTRSLVQNFESVLSTPPTSSTSASKTTIDPFAVLKDASELVKAHATKLGLLLLNKPFTPTAVAKVFSEISSTCLPAMMGAVELLGTSVHWGSCVEQEIKSAVRQLIAAIMELVKDIERVHAMKGKAEAPLRKQQSDSTLASTGQVWSACDSLIELATLGPAGVVCKKAKDYQALLRDAIDELKDFSADVDEGYSDDAASDQDGDVHFGPSSIPSSQPELRAQVESSVKKLGLLEVAYKAVNIRWLKTFPFDVPGPDSNEPNGSRERKIQRVRHLDRVMSLLKQVPDEVDELAGKFYDLDGKAADAQLRRCCSTMTEAVDVIKDSSQESDIPLVQTFSDFITKWKGLMQS